MGDNKIKLGKNRARLRKRERRFDGRHPRSDLPVRPYPALQSWRGGARRGNEASASLLQGVQRIPPPAVPGGHWRLPEMWEKTYIVLQIPR